MDKYIISSASVIDGQLELHSVMHASSRKDAIEKAQDELAEDFGYASWNEYLEHMDPKVTEKDGISYRYSLYDSNCGHEEMYMIEEVA